MQTTETGHAKTEVRMRQDASLGLDELMIVNPSSSDSKAVFLGEDGTLYRVQGVGEEDEQRGMGHFFLGEDGTLYQVQGYDLSGSDEFGVSDGDQGEDEDPTPGHLFLGEDGTLYEVVR
jgi:hypothetical protein